MNENIIFKMYNELNLGICDICKKCRSNTDNLSSPVSIWQVGKNYYNSKNRILFVGKNARGNPGVRENGYINSTMRADELINDSKWAYWDYTKSIAKALYGEDFWEQIAFTNMVKCNNSDDIDTTSDLTKQCCIRELKIINRELSLLRPDKIIFYTGKAYDFYLKEMFEDINTYENTKKEIGKKQMPWWSFNANFENKRINVLRIGHPERMKKIDYIDSILQWIKRENFEQNLNGFVRHDSM